MFGWRGVSFDFYMFLLERSLNMREHPRVGDSYPSYRVEWCDGKGERI